MWYNILPSAAIVAGVLAVPAVVMAGLHKLYYGNIYQRSLVQEWQRASYLRDERITGQGFRSAGLENIPDEEELQ
ncbi:hypothetical protein Pmani_012857 [Petrolisthes manimaculis]|uniref:NADH dehydrogenase [ubiquinone] 1 alpha subcomplex subunit 1 n=1 Tax=Petrolisthes manimaculis TaxID=1843537 RepID=A0AAE1PW61_9EUCA|nr:hypothetical protein Pmani_012857 [Petrolisthes manimaculis]